MEVSELINEFKSLVSILHDTRNSHVGMLNHLKEVVEHPDLTNDQKIQVLATFFEKAGDILIKQDLPDFLKMEVKNGSGDVQKSIS